MFKETLKNMRNMKIEFFFCRFYICNEGYYARDCPRKEKSAKKMIKSLENKNLKCVLVMNLKIFLKYYIYEIES